MDKQRYLLITDLHLENKHPGQLKAQTLALKKIYDEACESFDKLGVIIMGDVFMNRRPTPSVLLAFKDLIHYFFPSKVFVLRGNHDSETKADDGITALSLFRGTTQDSEVEIITHSSRYNLGFDTYATFIPHYEDERIIKKALQEVPDGDIVFGHFGYFGVFNSFGDADSNITLDQFHNLSFLGHIHGYLERGLVTILGTPYCINFQDAGKEKYYGILTVDSSGIGFEKHLVSWGPRHLIYNFDELSKYKDSINDENYYTYLRVYMNSLTEDSVAAASVFRLYDVDVLDIKYKPVSDFDTPNTYVPSGTMFSITDEVIRDYIDNAATVLTREDLLKGLKQLKNEDK